LVAVRRSYNGILSVSRAAHLDKEVRAGA